MMRRRLAPLALAAVAAAGCAQGTDPPGTVGYVLLDSEARSVLTLEHDGWEGAPLLPVAVDIGEPITVSWLDRSTRIELRADMLAYVHGARAEVTWLEVGEEMRDDRLIVLATGAAAEALAERLGGTSAARGDGLWAVMAPDILERGSFLEAPEGVLEVLPDMHVDRGLGDLAPPDTSVGSLLDQGASWGGDEELGGGHDGSREAALVGVYVAGGRTLVLDASGGFTFLDSCSGEVTGAGLFHAANHRVVLRSDHGSPMVLARDGSTLLEPGGAAFLPLLPPAAADSTADDASYLFESPISRRRPR